MNAAIPSIQKAAVIKDPGPDGTLAFQDDVPVRSPESNEVLVKLAFSGVCGSEIRALLGWSAYTAIVGHEGVGYIVQTGPAVPDSMLGQRVGVKWLYSACAKCSICARGFPNNCPSQLNTGRNVPGTLQQYVIADARYITRIPEGLASEVAAPLLCAGLTMMGAIAKLDGQLNSGDWVVVSGSGGGLGHLGVQLAARIKGYRVIAVDSGEAKRDLSLNSGAHHFIDFSSENIEKRVIELTGEGAHAIIVVSGSQDAFRSSPRLVRNMGVIVCVGLPPNDFNIPIPASLCSARALSVTGVAVGNEEQMEQLLQYAVVGKIRPQIELKEFEELSSIFHRLRNDSVTGRIVVKMP